MAYGCSGRAEGMGARSAGLMVEALAMLDALVT